jgi:hypothetical protein
VRFVRENERERPSDRESKPTLHGSPLCQSSAHGLNRCCHLKWPRVPIGANPSHPGFCNYRHAAVPRAQRPLVQTRVGVQGWESAMQGSPRRPYFVQIPGFPTQNAPGAHGVVTVPASPVHRSPTAALGTHLLFLSTVAQ